MLEQLAKFCVRRHSAQRGISAGIRDEPGVERYALSKELHRFFESAQVQVTPREQKQRRSAIRNFRQNLLDCANFRAHLVRVGRHSRRYLCGVLLSRDAKKARWIGT